MSVSEMLSLVRSFVGIEKTNFSIGSENASLTRISAVPEVEIWRGIYCEEWLVDGDKCCWYYIDMSIDYKKSCSMQIGPRCNAKCANIVSLSGQCISWVTELRYLGIFLTCSRIFTCLTDSAKRSFYRSANAIFGKVGIIASEETVLELIKTKCIPALMFGMEACPLKKRDIISLNFVVNIDCS